MKYPKPFLLLFLFLFTVSIKLSAQAKDKPSMMYVIDGAEVSEAYVQELSESKQIKAMRKGITDDERAALVKKYGERAEDSFVAVISVYSDKELEERSKITPNEDEVARKKQAAAEAEEATTLVNSGDMAPDFTVQMLDGRSITLSDLKGKVVLLNFWATWCGPCMLEFKEIPYKILKPFDGKDFVFLPISRGEMQEVVMKKMKKLNVKGIDFPVGLDPEKEIYNRYATQFIPRNFLIDATGKVVLTSIGYNEEKLDDIVKEIDALLK